MTVAVPTSGAMSYSVPLDPGNPVDLIPGGGAFVALFVVFFLAVVGVAIWRMTLVSSASKSLGLSDEQRLLAMTDEHAGTAIVAGAIVRDAMVTKPGDEPTPMADLPARLDALQRAFDQGLVTPEEYASARQSILDSA